jgi:hypothetical protein
MGLKHGGYCLGSLDFFWLAKPRNTKTLMAARAVFSSNSPQNGTAPWPFVDKVEIQLTAAERMAR